MSNVRRDSKNKKTEIITIKCSLNEKERLQKKSKEKGQVLSTYLLESAYAGTERKRSKDKKRTAQMVITQEAWNQFKAYFSDYGCDKRAEELLKEVEGGLLGLWEY